MKAGRAWLSLLVLPLVLLMSSDAGSQYGCSGCDCDFVPGICIGCEHVDCIPTGQEECCNVSSYVICECMLGGFAYVPKSCTVSSPPCFP